MENGTGGSFSSLSSHPNFKKVNVPFIIKKKNVARCWWLTLIILVTQEAEIRRIMVQSQPAKIIHKILCLKTPHHKKGLECLNVWALVQTSNHR
jgi:hypothetical protein